MPANVPIPGTHEDMQDERRVGTVLGGVEDVSPNGIDPSREGGAAVVFLEVLSIVRLHALRQIEARLRLNCRASRHRDSVLWPFNRYREETPRLRDLQPVPLGTSRIHRIHATRRPTL